MIRLASSTIIYHGWQIRVVTQGGAFVFHCYPPQQSTFCNDGETYPNFKAALMAACHFVDRELAIKVMLEVAIEWLDNDLICEEEYWNLTAFD